MTRPAVVAVTTLVVALLASAAVWPQGLGIAGTYGPAQVVAMRGLGVAGGAGVVAVLLLVAVWWRAARIHLLAAATVIGAATVVSAIVLAGRGFDTGAGATTAADGDVTVLAFNTLHDGAAAEDIAAMVVEHGADVVVLPETSRTTAAAVAELSGDFQVFHHEIDSITSTTSLLVSDGLGRYGDLDAHDDGALASFTVRPETPGAPPITAVHAYPPGASEMRRWRTDTAWAVRRCEGADGAVVAGDFNATLDHPAFGRLTRCVDAADAVGSAAVGTWPAGWPAWAGTPIDHVVVDGREWDVAGFRVLDAVGGSDHRPVLAVLRRR